MKVSTNGPPWTSRLDNDWHHVDDTRVGLQAVKIWHTKLYYSYYTLWGLSIAAWFFDQERERERARGGGISDMFQLVL